MKIVNAYMNSSISFTVIHAWIHLNKYLRVLKEAWDQRAINGNIREVERGKPICDNTVGKMDGIGGDLVPTEDDWQVYQFLLSLYRLCYENAEIML